MGTPFLYVESCPICGDGLCRIRVCVQDQKILGCILCDECEAVWTDPSLKDRIAQRPGAEGPECPTCGLSLWSRSSHWANVGEACLLGWFDRVHLSIASE